MNRKAVEFSLPDQEGDIFTLSKSLDKNIALIFYPKDNSPVCTKQLCDYRDNLNLFYQNNILPIGISIDSIESHRSFYEKYKLNFRILSDSTSEVSKNYDALNFLKINKRKIVIINKSMEIIFEDSVIPFFYTKSEDLIKKINNLHLT